MIQIIEEESTTAFINVFYCLNPAFPQTHFHAKSAYLGPFKVPAHTCLTYSSEPLCIYKKHIKTPNEDSEMPENPAESYL